MSPLCLFLLNWIVYPQFLAMNMKDRTAEFYALAERIKKRGTTKNRNSPTIDKRNASAAKTRSEFSRLAAQLGRNIAATSEKLEQLTYCKWA